MASNLPYLPLMKQVMKQYFLLLNGQSYMKPNSAIRWRYIGEPEWHVMLDFNQETDSFRFIDSDGNLYALDVGSLFASGGVFSGSYSSWVGITFSAWAGHGIYFCTEKTGSNAILLFMPLGTQQPKGVMYSVEDRDIDIGTDSIRINKVRSYISDADLFRVAGLSGVDGSFQTAEGKTVTVNKGLITSIV